MKDNILTDEEIEDMTLEEKQDNIKKLQKVVDEYLDVDKEVICNCDDCIEARRFLENHEELNKEE